MTAETAIQTPEARARASLKFDETRAGLIELAGVSTSLTAVDTDDNLAAAKAARLKLRSTRTTIEKTGKAARDDATALGKAIIAAERELIALIQPEEQRLLALIEAEELRRTEALRAAREAEERRAAEIRQTFERVRSLPGLAGTGPVEAIPGLLAEAQALLDDHSHLPEDMHAAARYEANVAITGITAARDRRAREAADAQELAQLRAERAERAEREQRAAANQAEVARAAQVVAGNAKPLEDDDDDLPPGFSPAPPPARALPDSVTVPLNRVVPLLQAAEAALKLLRRKGLGDNIETVELAQAIEEARHG